jgi:hypothetical protein
MTEKSPIKLLSKIALQIGAIISFAYALWGFGAYIPESAPQETVIALWQIKYLLVSLIFEVGSLNLKLDND